MICLLISNILCFIWPLFLTLKLLNREYHKNRTIEDKNSDQVKFLLNYWMCYIAVDYIEKLVLSSVIFWPLFGIGYFPELFSSSVKLWLFYNHGCLVINYCYLECLLRKIACEYDPKVNPFDVLELNFLHPVMKALLTPNHLVPLKFLLCKKKGIVNWTITRIVQFSQCFIESVDQSFLQFSLEYICYMDSKQDLKKNFEITKTFIDSITSFLQYQFVRLKIQEEDSLPRIMELLLRPNVQKNVLLQYISKHKSYNDKIAPVHMDSENTKTYPRLRKELEYESRKRI